MSVMHEAATTGSPRLYGDEEPASAEADFEDLFHRHHDELFRAMWLVTRNRHEAEEIAQEAFLRVLERWNRVRSVEDPAGYLYRTAMNVFRSRRRRAAVAVRRAVGQLPREDGLAEVEEREAVVRVLAPLSPRQRAAIVLTDLLGLSSDEAGRALGVKAVTVRVLAARARAALREEMQRHERSS
jgi:RNA polymerase sigma factor (sigma-70 family)